MTESTTEAPNFDFDAWLDGATVTEVSVEILQDGKLVGQYRDWRRRYDRAVAADQGVDRTLGDRSPLAALTSEGEELLAKMKKSRATWYVKALTDEDLEEITKKHPMPEDPEVFSEAAPRPVHDPTDAQAKAFLRSYSAWEARRDAFNITHKDKFEAWHKARKECNKKRGAEMISRAVSSIEVDGVKVGAGVSLEQALTLDQRIGPAQTKKLIEAINEAIELEPEIPAGFLSENSEGDQI